MKDTEKGIKELNLEKDKKVFNHCFTGKRPCESEVGWVGWVAGRWSGGLAQPCVWGVGMWSMVGGWGHGTQTGGRDH